MICAYLRSMVTHATADYYRSMQKSEDLMQEIEKLLEESSTLHDGVHAEAFLLDPMEYIEAIYEELTEEERLLLSLKYEGGYKSKEIAEVIGISPSLIRMRLSRINEKMRKQIKKKMNE